MPYKRKDKDANLKKPWIGQVTINGQCKRKTFATKAEAKNWEVGQKERVVSLTATVSLAEWAIRYLDYGRSKFVVQTYQEKVRVFRNFFKMVNKDLPVDNLSPGIVLNFLKVQNDERSGYAANKDRKNLVAAWSWGVKYLDGFPQGKPNPCLTARFSETRQQRYVPTENDFWSVFEVCTNEQDRVMLLAYLHTGARRSELFRLRWDDVDFANSTVRLLTRKNREGTWEEARLPMTDDLFAALLEQKKTATGQWVFRDPETSCRYEYRQHFMRRLCTKAGVKPFGFHAIRHLTASILARAGVPMVTIQAILRHKNLSTTERYIRGLESVRPSLKILPGRKTTNGTTRSVELKVITRVSG